MDSGTKLVLSTDISKKQHLKDIKHNLKQFKKDKNELAKLVDDQTVFDLILSTRVMLSLDDYREEIFKYILEYKSHEKFALLFEYLCSIRNELNFLESRYLPELSAIYTDTSREEKRVYSLIHLDWIINYILVRSIDYRKYLCQNTEIKSFISTCIAVLNDLDFFNKFISFYDHGLVVNILNWLSKSADDYRHIWKEYNSVQVILKFSQTYEKWKIYAYSMLANIALDADIEQLDELTKIIEEYAKLTVECVNNSDGKVKQEFNDINDTVVNFEVLSLEDKLNKIVNSITGFLFGLYKFAISDKLKQNIYDQPGLKEALKKLISTGLDVEKHFAIQLLAQLSFNKEICKNLSQDTELVECIKEQEQKASFEFQKLKKTCQNFLWILEKAETETKIEETKEQIMISYNAKSRDLCLKIKSELEKLNYKVWIDVDEIHGSSLNSMATAIEESKCILICSTEKYRQSVNCQAEAQYAFRLNKIIIPLIMQPGYHKVKGWLGIILGDKIFVDFTKYKFEEALKRLHKQIKLNMKNNDAVEKSTDNVKQVGKSTESVKPVDESTENLKSAETGEPVVAENPPLIEEPPAESQDLKEEVKQEQTENANTNSDNNEMSDKPEDKTPAETITDVDLKVDSVPLSWSDEQVKNWCDQNELNNLYDTLKPLNGQILNQLHQMQIHTPEFFFKALTKYDSIDIKVVALFSCLLKELFDNN